MPPHTKHQVSLKTVAERVGLAPCSVSAVLNDTVASRSIPQATKDRIFRAASELNYRPNLWARSLRTKRTRMVAIMSQDFGHPAVANVLAAAQNTLQRQGYLLVLRTSTSDDAAHLPADLQQRGVEGVIAIDTPFRQHADFPAVTVDLSFLSSELIGNGVNSWLRDLGSSAAEAIMHKIEGIKPAREISGQPAPFELTISRAVLPEANREPA
jgi:DNA-binding LacI/PurR family transcriptional regulator